VTIGGDRQIEAKVSSGLELAPALERSRHSAASAPCFRFVQAKQACPSASAALTLWTKPGRRVGPSARSRFPPKRASRADVALSPSRTSDERGGTRRWLAAPLQQERKPSAADVEGVVPSSQRQIGPRMDQADRLGSRASPCLRRHLGDQPSTATGIRNAFALRGLGSTVPDLACQSEMRENRAPRRSATERSKPVLTGFQLAFSRGGAWTGLRFPGRRGYGAGTQGSAVWLACSRREPLCRTWSRFREEQARARRRRRRPLLVPSGCATPDGDCFRSCWKGALSLDLAAFDGR
jgi:hypothetical protein